MNSQKGVTLTELVIVIAIIGILAGLAVPGYGFYRDKFVIRQDVENISGLITQTKFNAMRSHNTWRVVFSPCNNQYHAEEYKTADGTYEIKLGPYNLGKTTQFGSVAASGPNGNNIPGDGVSFCSNTITFNTLGSCNAGYVYLQSQKKNAAIRVMAASGLVSTWYCEGGAWVRK